jgi:hypothetical protein
MTPFRVIYQERFGFSAVPCHDAVYVMTSIDGAGVKVPLTYEQTEELWAALWAYRRARRTPR